MNSKFLITILYAFVLIYGFQYFFGTQKNTGTQLTSDIVLSVKKDSLTIPNLPLIEILNTTATGITVNPCNDVTISVESKTLGDIQTVAPGFCTKIDVAGNGKATLSFWSLAQLIAKLPGKYIVSLKTPLWDRLVTFEESTPSSIRTLLTNIFYNPIYNFFVALLIFLPGHTLGWAILIITLIIRLILLVPQHHMLTSQKKLQVIQPKVKEIQKKYKDDQAKLGMEMLELYKKEWVNPMGSCLPLLIQMPILIGLYWVISGITDPSNFYHLYSVFAGFDPKNISSMFFGLNLQGVGGIVGLIFSIILAGIQYIQARLSFAYNPPAKKEEKKIETKSDETPEFALDPDMMKNMMLYMFPVMIAVSAYFFPLGIGLYWFIGTLFVIGQQWYVNKVAKKK